MLADEIRNSGSEHEVYFLLTSYIEAVRYADKLHCGVPEFITRVPLSGESDLKERFEHLLIELDLASKRLDYASCTVLKECMHMFGFALERLGDLNGRQHEMQGMAAPALNSPAAHAQH